MRLGGLRVRMCLTLGALAEIERGLGVRGVEALVARLRALGAGDLEIVLSALIRGGGGDGRVPPRVTPGEAARAVALAFEAAGD